MTRMVRMLLPGAWWPTWVRPKRFVPNWLFILSLKRKWSRFYEVWPWAALLLLLASPSFAQSRTLQKADRSLDELVAARAKLIKRYVGTPNYEAGSHLAWGVSVCGGVGIFNGEQRSWLTVYVYKDSVAIFTKDFGEFAAGGKVDGVPVAVVVIKRPKP